MKAHLKYRNTIEPVEDQTSNQISNSQPTHMNLLKTFQS